MRGIDSVRRYSGRRSRKTSQSTHKLNTQSRALIDDAQESSVQLNRVEQSSEVLPQASSLRTVDYQRPGRLTIAEERPIPVNSGDWDRIRKQVAQLDEPTSDNSTTWSATALGAFITCVVALVTFHATPENDSATVIVGFAMGAVFSALFALCFYRLAHQARQTRHISVRALCEDMDDVATRAGHSALSGRTVTSETAGPLVERLASEAPEPPSST